MKIAVLGWYGHDNAGDERIKYCLGNFLRNLAAVEAVEFFDLHDNAINGPTDRFDAYDLVIIGGGGLILSQHNYHDFIRSIKTKMLTIGVSVEGGLVGNRGSFAQALIDRSLAVLVRDTASYAALKNLDRDCKVRVSTDLTFLEPYELSDTPKSEILGVNLFPKVIRQGLNILGFNLGSKVINFQRVMQDLSASFKLSPIPLYCVAQPAKLAVRQMNDVNYLKRYFSAVPEKFDHSAIDNCSVFISMRLHGVIFAIQKGIPAITLGSYPKQVNFMKEVGLQNVVVDPQKLQQLPEAVSYVEKNSEDIADKLREYRHKATTQIRQDLIEVMNLI